MKSPALINWSRGEGIVLISACEFTEYIIPLIILSPLTDNLA